MEWGRRWQARPAGGVYTHFQMRARHPNGSSSGHLGTGVWSLETESELEIGMESCQASWCPQEAGRDGISSQADGEGEEAAAPQHLAPRQ